MSPWEETIEQISRRGWPNGYGLNREGFDGEWEAPFSAQLGATGMGSH